MTSNATERRLEEAAMNAWPALQVSLLDGWVLRFGGGYTKRANSINPTYPSASDDLLAKVETCEAIYGRKGLPCIFRLTSFGVPPGLDNLLLERGYAPADHTLVMRLDLAGFADSVAEIGSLETDPWLDHYVRLSRSALSRREAHLAILRQIPGEAIFATYSDPAVPEPVACGLAVVEGEQVGLFDIVTDPDHRNRGHGAALVGAMITWAKRRGATEAYLQVVAENAPAVALYRKFGFTEAYHYWYRIHPAGG